MRILVVHSRYASGHLSGENRVVADEARLLGDAGHDVLVWAPSGKGLRGARAAAAGMRTVWSRTATGKLRSLMRGFSPDVIHCHNLFPLLSPAVLREASGHAPVLATLHNYRLLCLPATFARDGRSCEDCLARSPWRGVVHGCYRNSRIASTPLALSLALHRAIGSFDRVSLYLAVSAFVRDKHIRAGFPRERIHVKPNFAWPGERRRGPGSAFLYIGRLAPEKGIAELVESWRSLPAPLLVIGDGPDAARLRSIAPPNVELQPPVPPDEIPHLLASARALVFPTLASEGAPRAIVEAFAAGVPVLARSVGAVPELVEDGVSGLLLPSFTPAEVAAAGARLLDDAEAERMGEAAWRAWSERYSPEHGLARLEQAYRLVAGATREARRKSHQRATAENL
jgi:glycosyltransferase involved in cell wall biosynthesis